MPFFLLVFLAGIAELSVLIMVGDAIGPLPTIGLLIAGVVVGGWLLRREGRRTLREISEATRLRRPPTRGIADGMLSAVGGILIIVPGFLSDLAGVLFLLPPTRVLLRRWMERSAERRSQAAGRRVRQRIFTTYVRYPGPAAPRGGAAHEDVVEGEVVSVSEDDEHGAEQPLPPRNERPTDGGGR